jgi:hypothetical protein
MPEKTEYIAAKGIIVITYTGKVTIAEAREATVKAIAIQDEKQTNRVVIDAWDMTAGPSITEMWDLVQSYPELEVPRPTRLAVVRPEARDRKDLTGFFEVICQNRCYNAKGFHTREAAEYWVLSD